MLRALFAEGSLPVQPEVRPQPVPELVAEGPLPLRKRVLDVAGALFLLALTSPLWLVAAIAVKATSPGPVLFRLTAMGRHGRTFGMFKFRTMVTDAEARFAQVAALNQGTGPMLKLESDPRITSAGRWLRRTSIDELPQLLNVLAGEMSLVGPRPIAALRYGSEHLEGWRRRRLDAVPGITGPWQVSGRPQDFDECCRLDIAYIETWSLKQDLAILAQTVPAVLRMSGAT
jgi:lipopolysaccharide/colanic/teichoic acid biosynthesis glycosyltransferase